MVNNSKQKKENKDNIVLILAIILLIIILFLIYKIGGYLIDEVRSAFYTKDLQETVLIIDTEDTESISVDSVSNTDSTEEKKEEPEEVIKIPTAVDFKSLQKVSKDAVAWIYDPGMVINYPIAQAADNDYYLRRNLSGGASSAGTLFMDYRNSADFSDWNTLIYGHNMKSGTMFASLLDYRMPDYYEEHPVMYLYVPGKRYKLELIVAYTTDVNDAIYQFPATEEEREAALNRAYRLSNFESGIRPGKEDRLVTLSTCSYAYDDARYVVIGRLVEE